MSGEAEPLLLVDAGHGTATIDLSVRGSMVIDLLGRATPETWRPWGSSFATSCPEADRPALGRAIAEADALVGKMTKRQLVALLAALGKTHDWQREQRASLVASAHIALIDRWFPRRFINPANKE